MGLFGRKKVIENPEVNADTPVAGTSTTSTTGNVSRTGLRPSHHKGAGVISLTPRILQFLLAILILALVGYAQHVYAHTFLQSAYVPALVAAILTILATLPLAFLHSLPGTFSHPLAAGIVDLFFALFWLAIMAELAAYSDVSAPTDATYYRDATYGQAYVTYTGTIHRLKTGWACGAAAAAFSAVEFILFLVSALLPLRGRFANGTSGAVDRRDSVGVASNHHTSVGHTEPPYEMRSTSANPAQTSPTNPTVNSSMPHAGSNADERVLGHGTTVSQNPSVGHNEGGVAGREGMIGNQI